MNEDNKIIARYGLSDVTVGMPFTFTHKVLYTVIGAIPNWAVGAALDLVNNMKISSHLTDAAIKAVSKKTLNPVLAPLLLKYIYYFHDVYERSLR